MKKKHRGLSMRPLSRVLLCSIATSYLTANLNTVLAKNMEIARSIQQEKIQIQGLITDSRTGKGISSVTIALNGVRMAATGADGKFTLLAPVGSSLTASTVGYESKTQLITSNSKQITLSLTESSTAISEVVVTALGIKREEKSLGYAVTTVKNEELTDAMAGNWTDALTGKVAGLNLVKSGGGPAGSNQIILRGETSLSNNNGALIVIDGVVTSGSSGQMTGSGSSNYQGADAPVDFGSSLADINPDDIESVSVLKGPGAAALYGSRGANGAIIITTKQGKSQKNGLGINFNTNTTFETINRWPDYQNEYGQGVGGGDLYYSYGNSADGPSTLSTSSAWGPKFDGQYYYQYNPDSYRVTPTEKTLWKPYKNNRKDFFEVGQTYTNNLSIAGGNEKTTVRFSYGNTKNKWIVPNTGYSRHSMNIQLSHQLSKKLTVSSKISYNNKNSDNLPSTGYNNSTVMYFMRGLTPNMDINWFKDYWQPGEENITQTRPFSTLLDNPYLMSNEFLNSQKRNGVVGNVSIDYKFNDQLSLMVRTATDFQYDARTQKRPFNTNKFTNGFYKESNIFTQEINSDFLLKYDNSKGAVIKYGAMVGGALMKNKYTLDELTATKLIYPGVYNFANAAERITPNPVRREYATNSLYAMANVSYKDYLFLDATARLDYTSTLASPDKSSVKPFFYPSVNTSFVVSQAFDLPESISFWKLRASIAGVGGGGTTPYLTSYTYPIADNFTGGLVNNVKIPNVNLKAENTTSYEVGTDFRMFKNKLTVDLTGYYSMSYNQILNVPIDPASGYTSQVINAGQVSNRGIELAISGKVLDKRDGFSWKPYGNMSYNHSRIDELPAESEGAIVLSTIFGSRGTVEARVGGRYGDLYGYGYARNEQGQIIYENGLPISSSELKYLGNATSPWKAGFGNEFSYKNFRFNILFDGQFGGVGYSLTHAVLAEEGKLKKTIPGRYNGIIGDGVVRNPDGTYSPNTVAANARDYYYAHYNRDNLESNIFSTNFIKLREVRFDYTLKGDVLKKMKLQKAVVGVYGRDLFVFSNWPSFDPEFGALNNGSIQKGAEIAQFPSTRSFGINLSVAF